MSTLVENVAKVTAAHAALKEAIAAKGVSVPAGTKLSGMASLVEQIETTPVPNYPRVSFSGDDAKSIVVPRLLVVDLINALNLRNLFNGCASLTSVTLPDGFGQNATNIMSLFTSCTSLTSVTLPDGFGQNATSVDSFFYNCTSLTSVTLPDGFGQKTSSMTYMFYNCSKLTSVNLPDGFGQNAQTAISTFNGCTSLTSVTLPDGFGQNATITAGLFNNCTSLTTITGNPRFKVSLDLSICTQLTHDSLMVVINGLQEVTTAQTLTLGTANLAKLTEDEKKVATDKGWTLA